MESTEDVKQPNIIDFSGDMAETIEKLESILCNTPWYQRLDIYSELPNETTLLIQLLRAGAMFVAEIYYIPCDINEDIRNKADEFLGYLSKRQVDGDLLNVAGRFLNHEIEIPPPSRHALYFPHINAYVRCGDLKPKKLLELLLMDGCERVLVFNSARPDEDSRYQAFYSFEMRAPKSYIIERMDELQEQVTQALFKAMERAGNNDIFPDVPVINE